MHAGVKEGNMNWDWEKLQQRNRQRKSGWEPGSGGGGPTPPDFTKIKEALNKWGDSRLILIILVIIMVGWLLTGFFRVEPGQVGVVQRFGAVVHVTEMGAGLNWHWPRPVGQATKVDTQQIRSFEIGFTRVEGRKRVNRDEALMLTKDKNIVHFEIIVHYQVQNPEEYLFEIENPEEVIKTTTESALRSAVGTLEIDRAIVAEGLSRIANNTQDLLQDLLDDYNSGLRVVNVRTERGDAPQEVRQAFHDVVRAMEDKERLIHRAEEYREDIIPRARGARAQRILEAQGEVKRFGQLLVEYRKAKGVTRQRLYLETIGDILPGVNKIIMDKDAAERVMLFPDGKGVRFETIEAGR